MLAPLNDCPRRPRSAAPGVNVLLFSPEFLGGNPSYMSWLPDEVVKLVEAALVTELSVVRADGRPITYPLIPLWDTEKVVMTSSILFSRKLEHLKDNPRVSLSFSDPVALGGEIGRASCRGGVESAVR